MQDRLPLRDVAADESASARIPEISRKWSAAQPFFAAADKRDIAAFRAAASSLAESMAPTAATAPVTAALYFHSVLCRAADAARPQRAALPEMERLALADALAAAGAGRPLCDAFLALAERTAGELLPHRHPMHPVAVRARRHIESHWGEPLSLSRVASTLGVTRTYLSALFRRECGVTLTEYIHLVRIERAEELLREGGRSLATIASLAGYGSYRHFHRSFLKLRRMSPRAFARGLSADVAPLDEHAAGLPVMPERAAD